MLRDDAVVERVEEDIADGTAAAVSGTPTTVVRDDRAGASEPAVEARPAHAFASIILRMVDGKP